MRERLTVVCLAPVEVEVSLEVVAPLRQALLDLYAASAETLSWSARRLLEHPVALSEVDETTVRVRELEAALDQVGWLDEEDDAAGRLDVARDVLLDAVRSALIETRERLGALSTARTNTQATRELVLQISELQELLDSLLTPSAHLLKRS